MLPPDSRVVLSDALRPPEQYRLDRAVATTFTLDMTSALFVPLAFAAQEVASSSDPIAVMESVRKSSARIDIFCQAGQLVIPSTKSALLSFLEPMIHPVKRPRPGYLFHPKIWLLRFVRDDGTVAMRLLVLTRNLTGDRSWDLCLRLDGVVGPRASAGNRALVDLVQALPTWTVHELSPQRLDGIASLTASLRRTEWEFPDDIDEITFHTLGLRGRPKPEFAGTRHLAIAPFCNDAGLASVTAESKSKPIVVSRQEDLDRLDPTTLEHVEAFVLNELAGLTKDDDEPQQLLVGLHSKLFIVEKGFRARLFVGSANATDAAFGGNIEVLVELNGKKSKIGIDTMLGADAPFRNLLVHHSSQPPVEPNDADHALENLVRAIASIPLDGTVAKGEAEVWVVRLTSEEPLPQSSGTRVTAELITGAGETPELVLGVRADILFTGLEVRAVTPFVIIRCTDARGMTASTVVRINLIGDPPHRLDYLLAQQVDTPEKFLQFLAMLLGMEDVADGLGEGTGFDGDSAWSSWNASKQGAFETIVGALVNHQSELRDLDKLVTRLESTEDGLRTLPDGFAELWSSVREVINHPSAASISTGATR